MLLLPSATDEDTTAERALRVYRVIGSPGYPLDECRVTDFATCSSEAMAPVEGGRATADTVPQA